MSRPRRELPRVNGAILGRLVSPAWAGTVGRPVGAAVGSPGCAHFTVVT